MEKIVEKIPAARLKGYDFISGYFKDKRVIMFDIETTGLSPMYSFTYIIGVNILVDGEWQIIQLFNDDGQSEPEMIREFMSMLKDYDVLVEFNGDRFDIPYIEKRMEMIERKFHISLTNNFSKIPSFDLMKCIRPYKFALGLPNIKQKTVEKLLGINRLDMYNGGQLINVYLDYLSTGSEKNRKLVLQHNRDDMEGMLFQGAVLAIDNISRGGLQVTDIGTVQSGGKLYLELKAKLDMPLPIELMTAGYGSTLKAVNDEMTLKVPIIMDTCRYYYSVKESDGYEEREGFFVTLISEGVEGLPIYKKTARGKELYLLMDDNFLGNKGYLSKYASAAAGQLMHYNGR